MALVVTIVGYETWPSASGGGAHPHEAVWLTVLLKSF
jgi:hypothetical protein